MDYVVIGCRALVGIVFLVSAATKIRPLASGEFAASVRRLTGLRGARARPVALGVVLLEGAVPVLLVVRGLAVPGFVLAGALLAAFSTAILVALRRGVRAPCRCFGAAEIPLGPRHLVRNALLGVAAAASAAALLVIGADDIAGLFREEPWDR
ncbi:methylamine utilization protein MauE [Streptosporangium fragile]|uniref:Methylamine utilization protein MauE n=1 Tax=Streptosporangium fragile TaxID=46186 RepID=A0ABN3W382_9ACTN